MVIREYKKDDLYDIAKVHVDTWKTIYVNIIPEEYLRNRTYKSQMEK